MSYDIRIIFLLFLMYSFVGWSLEVIGKLLEKGKFVNRGFLVGPYCPIYGVGSILMIILLNRYINDPQTLFIMSILLFSVLEYSTSYFMEKIFKIRWWDYTRRKFNINGRICLETMIPFGCGGMLIMYVVNPFFLKLLSHIPSTALTIISIVLALVFVFDLCMSTKVIFNLKSTVRNIKKDATEEITAKVKEFIMNNAKYAKKRLVKAFPKLKIK